MRVGARRRVSRVDEVAIQLAGRKAVVVDDIHAGVRIPAGGEMGDVLAVDGPLRRSGLRWRDRVAGERERRGHRRCHGHARDGPRSRSRHRERGERGETRREPIETTGSEPRQTDEAEKASRRGTCQIRRIEATRQRRILAEAANDDPARKDEGQGARDIRDEDGSGQRCSWIDVRLDEQRGKRAGRRGQREGGDTWSTRASIEEAAQRRAAADAKERHADDEVRQVIPVGGAEEPGLRYLEEQRCGGDEADARQAGARHQRSVGMSADGPLSKPEQRPL